MYEREIPLEYYTERGVEPPGLSFIPGEDFDPQDEDDVAAVRLAMENDMADQLRAERRENEMLRERIAYLESETFVSDPYEG